MTKSKIMMATGTFVLAVAGFLATSAHSKYAKAVSAYFKTAGNTIVTVFKAYSGTTVLTTVKVSNAVTAYIQTSGGSHVLYEKNNATKTLYTKF